MSDFRYPVWGVASLGLFYSVISLAAPTAAPKGRALLNRREATVGTVAILKSDISRFKKTIPLRAQLDPLFANHELGQKGDRATDAEVVDFLISDALIRQQFPIQDAEVEQEVNAIQNTNRIDREGLKQALKAQGFRYVDYFELMRSGLSKRMLIDRDIRTKVHVSDDDVKSYYESVYKKDPKNSHASSPTVQSYRIQIIGVTTANYKSAQIAHQTIVEAEQALKAGESFESVAKRVSDDPTAPSGGDLGFLTQDEMSPEIFKQIKGLMPQQISKIVGSPSRYFILRLAETKSMAGLEYTKAKETIQNILTAQEFSRQIRLWIERQKQKTTVHYRGQPAVSSQPSI